MASSNAGAAGGARSTDSGCSARGWFFTQADTFPQYLYAIFQGIFWPSYMIFEAFQALA